MAAKSKVITENPDDTRDGLELPPSATDAVNDTSVNENALSVEDRVTRLETLAIQYFGTHHFAPPALAFNENAERDAARARFKRDMEEIEAKARAGNTGVPAATITQPH